MKKAVKTSLIVAAILFVAGIAILALSYGLTGCDLSKLNTKNYITTTFEITETFNSIDVDTSGANIVLAVSEDGQCKVVCHDSDDIEYSAKVVNDTLTVSHKVVNFEFISFDVFVNEEIAVTVYLPENIYNKVSLNASSGSIKVPSDFGFMYADLRCSSGSISCSAVISDTLTAKTSSGSTTINNFNGDEIQVSSSSGSINLNNVSYDTMTITASSGSVNFDNCEGNDLNVETSSGSISLRNVISDVMTITASSGSVSFDRCDGNDINVETSSGSVKGTLLTSKKFVTDTSSGSVHVPSDDAADGTCNITTSSGSIKINIA